MQRVKKALESELVKIDVSENTIKVFRELAYSASETNIIPFSFHGNDDELMTFIQLVKLASKLKKCPSKLRL